MTDVPRIECLALGKSLPSGDRTLTILDGIDLEVAAGELVAIVGPSGSVRLDGVALEGLGEDQLALLRREKVGFVFQSFHLLENLTARENVLVPLELIGAQAAGRRTDELLEQVGLGERGHHYPAQLSGGEQQRVALARAFASRPSILLADEPTGNLDSATGAHILDLLLDLREARGTTLVLVTHDPAIAARADREVHLRGGRIESAR